jgi:Tfp pilus assembly protein PilZ
VASVTKVTAEARFRAHARRKVRLRVVVWHPHAGWQSEADVLNLGLGGACVSLGETPAVGDRVTVAFVTPTLWDPLQLAARVAWIGPATRVEAARAGLAFEPREQGTLYALYELMSTLGYED